MVKERKKNGSEMSKVCTQTEMAFFGVRVIYEYGTPTEWRVVVAVTLCKHSIYAIMFGICRRVYIDCFPLDSFNYVKVITQILC